MSAAENTSANTPVASKPGSKRYAVPGVSMRDLLAAGAAARAVSTPPRPPEGTLRERSEAA